MKIEKNAISLVFLTFYQFTSSKGLNTLETLKKLTRSTNEILSFVDLQLLRGRKRRNMDKLSLLYFNILETIFRISNFN